MNRNWPFRRIKQLDKQICSLRRNATSNKIEQALVELLKEREQLLAPVQIRI